jgi:exosome complex component RRP4
MGKLLVKDKDIVVPGEVMAEGLDFLPGGNTRREDDKIIANGVGIVNISNKIIKLIPTNGGYIPKRDDVVVGTIVEINNKGWMVDIKLPFRAMITLKDGSSDYIQRGADLTKYYDLGDLVMAKICNVASNGLLDLTMREPKLNKLENGRLIEVSPMKVPRIIGKKASMITIVKEKTNCRISVGQNGLIWVSGDPKGINVAIKAIEKIDKESHKSGLTEEIEKFLDEQLKLM